MSMLGHLLGAALIVGLIVWSLTAIQEFQNEGKQSKRDASRDFYSICMDGVSYWYLREGYAAQLAVRIDPETMQPKGCK